MPPLSGANLHAPQSRVEVSPCRPVFRLLKVPASSRSIPPIFSNAMFSTQSASASARKSIRISVLLGIAFVLFVAAVLTAATPPPVLVVPRGRSHQVATLRERLIFGLEARLPSEVAFVEAVVHKVHTGKLPQRVVDQTFFWARDRASFNRNGIERRPIIFFQPAMAARAKKLKVDLDVRFVD